MTQELPESDTGSESAPVGRSAAEAGFSDDDRGTPAADTWNTLPGDTPESDTPESDTPESDTPESDTLQGGTPLPDWSAGKIVLLGLLFEAALVAVALLFAGLFGFYDQERPLESLFRANSGVGVAWGAAAAIPMIASFFWFYHFPAGRMKRLAKLVRDDLAPFFARLNWFQLLLVSIAAGVGEEILFRWCIQAGLQELLGGNIGAVVAIAGASIVFGLCHFVSVEYFVITFIYGIYLGTLYVVSGSLLAPLICHAAYDFVAFLVITRNCERPEGSTIVLS